MGGGSVEDWLRGSLSAAGLSGERLDRVISRIPAYLRRGEPLPALSSDDTDYESLEGLRLLVSAVGSALSEEGEEGRAALEAFLDSLRSLGRAARIAAEWYSAARGRRPPGGEGGAVGQL